MTGEITQLRPSTQVQPPVTERLGDDESDGGTSTPTLTTDVLGIREHYFDRGLLELWLAQASTHHSIENMREILLRDFRDSVTRVAPPDVSLVPISRVTKLGGATVLVICILSLAEWYITRFAAINPILAVMTSVAAMVFIGMGLMLEMKESTR